MPKRLTMEEIKDRLYEAIAGGANFGPQIRKDSGYSGGRYMDAIRELLNEGKILSKKFNEQVYGYYLPGHRPPIYSTAPRKKMQQGEAAKRIAQACVTTYGSPVVTYRIENGRIPEWDCVKRGRAS